MKSIHFSKKLTLNKKTIMNLNELEMGQVKGGYIKSQETNCFLCETGDNCTTYYIPCASRPVSHCMC